MYVRGSFRLPSPPVNRTHLLLLGLILVLATAVRAYHLSDLGYWTDELCTLSDADGHGLGLLDVPADRLAPPLPIRTRLADAAPASRVIPELVRTETHPPVYFLLLRAWESTFGDGEAAVRSLDVGFSVAAVALLFFAAQPDVGPTGALWACLVMAVASPQVTFAQEARDYAPVLAFALAAAVLQRRLIDRPTMPRAAVLAGCLLAMTLTHYYAAGVAAALAVHAAVTARGRPLRYAMAAFAAAAAAFVMLWGPAFVRQAHAFRANDTAWLTDAAPGHRQRALLALCRLPVRWVADVRAPAVAWGGVLFLGVAAAYVFRPRLRLWALWVAIPTAVVAVTDLLQSTTQLTLVRFTLFATPGAYVLVAAAVPRGRLRWGGSGGGHAGGPAGAAQRIRPGLEDRPPHAGAVRRPHARPRRRAGHQRPRPHVRRGRLRRLPALPAADARRGRRADPPRRRADARPAATVPARVGRVDVAGPAHYRVPARLPDGRRRPPAGVRRAGDGAVGHAGGASMMSVHRRGMRRYDAMYVCSNGTFT